MPDLQSGIRTRLLADATVATAVGTRVTWVDRPQASALPAIVLQTISDPRPAHMKDYDGARMTRVQMDIFASKYSTALSLARAAIAALKDPATVSGKKFGGTFVDGQRDLSEDVGGTLVHRQSVDLLVWHAGD
jgi:hypothetical protein